MPKRILIVAATIPELTHVSPTLRVTPGLGQIVTSESAGQTVDVLVTGVGMVATAARLSQVLARQRYEFALNVGLCGSFDAAIGIGQVVHVVTDRVPELGAEDGERFIPASDLKLVDDNEFPFSGGRLVNDYRLGNPVLHQFTPVHGVTVNTVHGRQRSIDELLDRLTPAKPMEQAKFMFRTTPQVESMEGAAFMYACLIAGTPFAQVRAVSNRVERRNREQWNLPLSIARLGEATLRILDAE